jgi:hypothetical protein
MPPLTTSPVGRIANFIAIGAFLLLVSTPSSRAQMLDLNANGMSDVWEQIYNASGLNPNADTDGDGFSNAQEALAGTNPTNALSFPNIPTYSPSGTNFTVTVPSALGKQYQLQSIQPLTGAPWTNWIVEATTIARTGTVVTLTAPAGVTAKFFRIGISDVDTDGDGLNDWEEYQLGLDPTKPYSNNQLDGSGQPMSDYAYAVSRMASQNIVTIAATDPSCVQPDPGGTASDLGVFTVTRGGFPLNTITVNLGLGGPGSGFASSGVDHIPLPTAVTLTPGMGSATVSVRPLANTNLLKSVVAQLKLLPGTGYTIGNASNASVTIFPSQTAKGTGLTGNYYTNSSATYASNANFNPALANFSRTDATIDFTWNATNAPFPGTNTIPNTNYFCVRWTGQVQPQYSETYFFVANTDDGVKLWVNDQLIIDNWAGKTASDLTGSITLQANVRYNIKMEYFQLTTTAVAHLSWYSASQAKQIIPTSRLYPSSVAQAPAAIVSPLNAYGFLNQPFTYSAAGANSTTLFGATGLPPGLNLNSANGLISGTPTLAGTYSVILTVSNSLGVSSSGLTITIFDTGSSVVREVWTNAPGVNVADIPLSSPPSSSAALGTLEGITDYGDNYGERVRGFITAPTNGNYYFWIAGSDSAELWISDDEQPANKIRRAYVSPSANPAPPPSNGTGSRQWNVQASQRSAWLNLTGGQQYYIEILHKAGTDTNDNWAVGWLLDPTGTNTTPSGVVPSYLLSKYYQPPAAAAPGTLYVATMLPGPGVTNMPTGTATLRMNADNSRATLSFSYSDLSSVDIGEHIDNDPYLAQPSQIMFDISAAAPQPDGTYSWFIGPVGTLSATDVLNVLNQGKAYITILSANYPDGELIGHFEAVEGTSQFTNPPAPPSWTDDSGTMNGAVRFLTQATFGPRADDISNVTSMGYSGWISNQFAMPASHHLSTIISNALADPTQFYPGNTVFNDWWNLSINAPDQLRQRVAFALSEIMVVSDQGVLQDNGICLTSYYDTLLDNAFGNFRTLLKNVTLAPAMGLYLNMQGNDKGSIINGTHANENYAREIQQLFSIGLYRMWPDGTLILTTDGNLVPTYGQNEIMGFAATFTGWNYYQPNQANGRLPTIFSPSANYTNPMVLVPTHHDLNSKQLLDNVVLPAGLGAATNSTLTNFDYYCSQDLEMALDNIFYHPNVGPFICRQLIQRLVTSNPSQGYLFRVVQAFNDNGAGVRGDLQAVINAILLDYEARSTNMLSVPTFGKQREPLLRVTAAARAFAAPPPLTGSYAQFTNQTVYLTFSPANLPRLTNETVFLKFTDTSGQPAPPSQAFALASTTPTNFSISLNNLGGLSTGTYTQMVNATISNMLTASVITTNLITVAIGSHGLTIGNPVYLSFVSTVTPATNGLPANGVYQVINTTNAGSFTVIALDGTNRGGACLIPKLTSGGFVLSQKTNVLFSIAGSGNLPMAHGMHPGDSFYVNFTVAGSPADGSSVVVSVPDATHFTAVFPSDPNNGSYNGAVIYPLVAPALSRTGSVSLVYGTYVLNATDTGGTLSLAQTPLNSPTVFNFFFPSYKYPGALATAGLTTPEFQLTSDTTAMFQMNFMEGGILGNTSNTNGLSSFNNGGGAIVLDIGQYMTTTWASNAGIPNLVDALNSQLCGGNLSPSARTIIINYVANTSNFPYTTPTPGQLRDRVRAVVHLLLCSPDFIIQR